VGAKEQSRQQVDHHFGFLGDYGYKILSIDDSTFWEVAVTYAADVNAVIVRNSREFQRVEVELACLTGTGSIPPVAIWTDRSRTGGRCWTRSWKPGPWAFRADSAARTVVLPTEHSGFGPVSWSSTPLTSSRGLTSASKRRIRWCWRECEMSLKS
jgi:hypothetical protein